MLRLLALVLATSALFTGATPETPMLWPTDEWTRHGTILEGNEGNEGTVAAEPILMDEDGKVRMWYRGGGWGADCAIHYAEADRDADLGDPDSWTRYESNPVYGDGGSDQSTPAALPYVLKVGDTYWISAVLNAFALGTPESMAFATSSDGLSWTTQAGSISRPAGTTLWGNRVVWVEGETWHMLNEAGPSPWRIYRYTSSDGLTWSIQNSGNPLSTLQLHASGMYGGPDFVHRGTQAVPKDGDTYRLYYHAAPASGVLPTSIYTSTSTDLDTWTTPQLVMEYLGSDYEVDQAADPAPLLIGDTVWMAYTGADNTEEWHVCPIASSPVEP